MEHTKSGEHSLFNWIWRNQIENQIEKKENSDDFGLLKRETGKRKAGHSMLCD